MYNICGWSISQPLVTLLQITKTRTAPLGEDGEVLLPRILRIGRIVSYARLGAKQKQDKPLGEDGGRYPAGYSDFSTTDLTDWTDCFLCKAASKTKTQ